MDRWGRSWEREAKSPIEAVLNDVRIRSCQEGNETGRNMASNGGYPGGRKCHFSPHDGGTILGTLFDYVVGSGVLTSYFRIGDEVSIGLMVGKDISSNAGGEVNGKVTCLQKRVGRSAN